jgi:hypothetical protein
MSDLDNIARRPVLAGIGATAFAAFFNPALVRAQALDRAPSVLVFDVAETLLDLRALRPLFQRVFGDGAVADDGSAKLSSIRRQPPSRTPSCLLASLQLGCSVCWAASTMSRSAKPMSPNSVKA